MKLSTLSSLFTLFLILILSGCAIKPKPKDEPLIDETLPKIALTKSGIKSTMKSIALEWEPITDKRVRGIFLYKQVADAKEKDKDNYYETIDNRYSTHFFDDNVKPNTKYTYFFKTYSDTAESVTSNAYNASTKPIFQSVPWIFGRSDMPRSAKIIWRPHKNEAVDSYLIQRKTLEDEKFENIARVNGRLNVEYIDKNLKNKFTYIYQIRAITYNKITSLPSEVVTINTKALPESVVNIKATTDIAKKINITWNNTFLNDFLHYKLYRSEDAENGFKVIAQTTNNSYVDIIKEDGQKYFYRVSVVDKDGLESKYDINSALGMTLVKPTAPALLEAKLVGNVIILKWDETDKRTVSYTIIKKYKKGLLDYVEDKFENIVDTKFTDTDIIPNTTYEYQVFSIDKNKILSEPSIEVEIKGIKDKQ